MSNGRHERSRLVRYNWESDLSLHANHRFLEICGKAEDVWDLQYVTTETYQISPDSRGGWGRLQPSLVCLNSDLNNAPICRRSTEIIIQPMPRFSEVRFSKMMASLTHPDILGKIPFYVRSPSVTRKEVNSVKLAIFFLDVALRAPVFGKQTFRPKLRGIFRNKSGSGHTLASKT